jgi:hypothetical protein
MNNDSEGKEYYGGMFWDVLLLSNYNENWHDFYITMCSVIPCQICVNSNMGWLEQNKIPDFKDNDEKNKWLWEHRLSRGGAQWRKKVKEDGYTLDSWLGLYKDKKFSCNG